MKYQMFLIMLASCCIISKNDEFWRFFFGFGKFAMPGTRWGTDSYNGW